MANNLRNDNFCSISVSVRGENQHRKKKPTEVFAHKLSCLHWLVSVSIHGYISYFFHCPAISTSLFYCLIVSALVPGSTFIWFLHSFLILMGSCFCLSCVYLFTYYFLVLQNIYWEPCSLLLKDDIRNQILDLIFAHFHWIDPVKLIQNIFSTTWIKLIMWGKLQ